MPRSLQTSALVSALFLLLASCSAGPATEQAGDRPEVGLFSTLPIYWGEGGFAAVLDGTDEKSWVRRVLEQSYTLEPLDTLEAEALAGLDRVILAQPRPLAPSENVALDDWVSAGGQLLVFADPLLTHHSDFALGDKRRPQDVVLISPILTRWGLELRFDEAQPGGERLVETPYGETPINLAGELALRASSQCSLEGEGLFARCAIGEGQVLVMVDAALLESGHHGEEPKDRAAVLVALTDAAFLR
ncbi:GldG family protein [Qipengyuania flava]|uniref:GldG family protein n=1 Tax=Qipengyuania flava TaxID=192812 RepID=UPI001C624D22|nr:GldG family protein [Qipengyuania flava]QYJ08050.1 GldG family protein [Qipengyuania flava]